MPAPPCLLFLHIPKTAGTSFRLGAITTLGASHCHFDYGRRSAETSRFVHDHVYENPDIFKFDGELTKAGCRLLGGHFGYPKYGPLFCSDRVLSFCREPGLQLMSHHAHSVRHNGDSRSLAQFLAAADGAGCQTRAFNGIPLEAVGFIGVTDRYDESLRVIRQVYGLEIQSMRKNANPDKTGERPYEIPAELAEDYAAAVAKDVGVYRRANVLLDRRLAALDGGYGFVHGAIQTGNHVAIQGFAFNGRGHDRDESVEVELLINDKPSASCSAVNYRPGLRGIGAPRRGYVGFEFKYSRSLKPGDKAAVRVASSEQVLGNYSIKIPHKTPQGKTAS